MPASTGNRHRAGRANPDVEAREDLGPLGRLQRRMGPPAGGLGRVEHRVELDDRAAAPHRAVELFADSSSLEIFAEDGACVFSQRIFLAGPVAVTARCDAGARLLSAEAALLPTP